MSILNLRVWKLGENKIIWELPIGAFLAQAAAWNDHFILRGSHICNVLDKLENLCKETCPKKNLSSLSSQQCQLRRRRISTSLWRKGKIFTNYWFSADSSLRFFWLSARNNSVIVWLSSCGLRYSKFGFCLSVVCCSSASFCASYSSKEELKTCLSREISRTLFWICA